LIRPEKKTRRFNNFLCTKNIKAQIKSNSFLKYEADLITGFINKDEIIDFYFFYMSDISLYDFLICPYLET
jgi:hypothetical protein